jgi:hydrogenase maturation protease
MADRIIIVDAMQAGRAPGTVYRVPFEDCARPECIASLHGFDLSRTMFLAGRSVPPDVIVIGIEPDRIAWGVELSATVQEALPAVIAAIQMDADRAGRPCVAATLPPEGR